MKTEKTDVATLIELLKMAAERWPHFETDQLSQHDLLREDFLLIGNVARSLPTHWRGKARIPTRCNQALEKEVGSGELKSTA